MFKTKKPYGLWASPISPELIGDSLSFTDVQWDSHSQTLVWAERRGKRSVIVAKTGTGAIRDLTDSRFSPRGRVGYGGGAFTVHMGIVYFVHDGRLYRLAIDGGLPEAITPKFGGVASPKVSPGGNWLIFAHTYDGQDTLALVDTQGALWPQKIGDDDDDFVTQPAWSPDGNQIAYIAWNHPQMPWNGTELRLLEIADHDHMPYVASAATLAGDENTAISQPEFSPDGRYLSYISDESGWNQLYLYDRQQQTHEQITTDEVEHGIPNWIQGNHTYQWHADSNIITYIRHEKAFYEVWQYDLQSKSHKALSGLDDYTHIDRVAVSPVNDNIAMVASGSTTPTRVITHDGSHTTTIARRSTTESLTQDQLSACEAIEWQGHDGKIAHGLYFAPKSNTHEGTGTPPLMVLIHGGPTSQRNAKFDMEVQFFTSRGFAVLQVNHRGSTGYGKVYMDMHQGNWGIYDVQDSITGAQSLVDRGLADASKIVIMGGSAGGYTALQALVDAPGFFKAAVVSYGVANQFSLVMDTHKFEERYSEWLLGALPEASDKYKDRSPLFHAQKIKDAIIIFQGTEDNVVPKSQSDTIVAALRRNGVPHEYVIYEGEGHGFRDPSNIVDFYEKTVKFLQEYVIYT